MTFKSPPGGSDLEAQSTAEGHAHPMCKLQTGSGALSSEIPAQWCINDRCVGSSTTTGGCGHRRGSTSEGRADASCGNVVRRLVADELGAVELREHVPDVDVGPVAEVVIDQQRVF